MLSRLDRRTRKARLLEEARAVLKRHVGAPNEIQRILIERLRAVAALCCPSKAERKTGPR
jgi:hypothetical protein